VSILVANKVYRYFWSLVFWWKFKIRECLGLLPSVVRQNDRQLSAWV